MPTLDEIANEQTNTPIEPQTDGLGEFQAVAQEEPNKLNELLNRLLTAETGEGSIEDYLDHPMNFLKSKGLAQMLRGVHGLGANLKLAIIDVGMGFLRFSKERKINNDVSSGGGFPS